jgi:hypothetical protein
MDALRSLSHAAEAIALAVYPLADKTGNQISKYGMIGRTSSFQAAFRRSGEGRLRSMHDRIPLPNRQQCRKMNFPFLAR